MNTDSNIYLAGHDGMVGSAIMHELHSNGYKNIITRSLSELDLRRQKDVEDFFNNENPDIVIIAAARVGGIVANNTYRAEFLYDNIMIEANLIHAAHQSDVEKLLFLGSSCIYPKDAPQPLKEEYLLTDVLEPTNEPYAIAKIPVLSCVKIIITILAIIIFTQLNTGNFSNSIGFISWF